MKDVLQEFAKGGQLDAYNMDGVIRSFKNSVLNLKHEENNFLFVSERGTKILSWVACQLRHNLMRKRFVKSRERRRKQNRGKLIEGPG